ncbi:UPF0481 protein At3g47200-like [Actinidia eriantha]|uniref:UPF0481 protein At3g47200-like n=1 Tax=Actinidia eriantha TaxID=165200 RepID=UPI00258CD378|nr:UPF0481 protein At3g47200-like [Actinidia eriantha]
MPLQTIVDNLTKVVQDLKDSYDSLGEVWQSDTGKFLRLMVLDGCFMLEVLCYYAEMSDSGNYAPKDPIFSAHGMLHVMNYIRRDMFLLENQLPMLVLIELAAAMNRRYTETVSVLEAQKMAEECLIELKSMDDEISTMVERQKMAEEWLIELKATEDETSTMVERQWKKQSIYKVPPHMTNLNKNAYRPQVVSFGPYHHGEEHLMPMEKHKKRALFHFLKRTKKAFQIIVDNLTKVVQDLKDSYDLLGDVWQSNTDGFLKLMVLDGCFMLEVLCYYNDFGHSGNYAPNDPIFSTHGILHAMRYIRRDMLLLENQLPIRVLIELAAAMTGEDTEKRHAQTFVNGLILWFTDSVWSDTGECLHLLDTFRKGMLCSSRKGQREDILYVYYDGNVGSSPIEGPSPTRREPKPTWESNTIGPKPKPKLHAIFDSCLQMKVFICCCSQPSLKKEEREAVDSSCKITVSVMELQEAGICFEAIGTGLTIGRIDEISFKDKVLRLPILIIDDTTESMFLNLIAFERLHVGSGNEVTSYVYFMKVIINSVEDVILLQSQGVIHNALESNEAVVQLFNLLAKDIVFNPHSSMGSALNEINVYRRKRWVKCRAKFARAYHLSTKWSPWGSWTLIFDIVLSMVQTAYTIYPYHHPNK